MSLRGVVARSLRRLTPSAKRARGGDRGVQEADEGAASGRVTPALDPRSGIEVARRRSAEQGREPRASRPRSDPQNRAGCSARSHPGGESLREPERRESDLLRAELNSRGSLQRVSEKGFEPSTDGLNARCSTIELHNANTRTPGTRNLRPRERANRAERRLELGLLFTPTDASAAGRCHCESERGPQIPEVLPSLGWRR